MKKRIISFLFVLVLTFTSVSPSFSASTITDTYFDSVADMQAASLTAGDVVQTRGFYAPGDGGGATYNVVASGTADNYFSFSVANNTIAQLQVENDTVNIRQLGAKGDGVTDDTQAVNAATLSQYETVYAPAGTYIVKPSPHPKNSSRRVAIVLGYEAPSNQTALVSHEGKNLFGEGRDLTIFKLADNSVLDENGNVIKYEAVISGYTPYMSDVTLKDFTIDQNIQNNPAMPTEGPPTAEAPNANYEKFYCIKSTLDHVIIQNIKFKHHGSNAIFAANTNSRGDTYEIHDCYFEFDMNSTATNTNYDNSCLYCVGDGFKIYNNIITTNLDFSTEITDMRNAPNTYTSQLYGVGGIEVHGNAQVYNNQVNKYYVGIHYRTVAGIATGSNIHDNTISNTSIGVSFGNDSSSLMTVSGAVFNNNTINISLAYKKGFRNGELNPCGFRTVNLAAGSTNLNFNGVTITNNIVSYDLSSLISGYNYNFGLHAGLILRSYDVQNINVSGNTFENVPGYGIEVNQDTTGIVTKNFEIINNDFINCGWTEDFNSSSIDTIIFRRAAIKINAQRDQGDISGIVVKDNTISDTSPNGQCLYAINVPAALVSADKVTLENNTESSISGKGFYVPYFASIGDQVYQRFPETLNVSSFPTDGTFYKDQKIQIVNGQEIESTWIITKSGVIGKEIPAESETGTVENSRLIVMDSSDHGIQSGDIINVRTTNGQTQENIWVCSVTDKKIYVNSLNLTGDVILTYSNAAWKQKHTNKDIETVFSATPEKTSVIVNEEFYVTVITHKDVNNIKIVNPSGSSMGIIEKSSSIFGDNKIWNVKIKLNSAGINRVFKVYGALEGLDYSNIYTEFMIENIYGSGTIPSETTAVISAIPEKNSVIINEEFYINVVTPTNVMNIRITNESGSSILTLLDKSSVISGDHKIWTIKIKIGTSGTDRVFKVYGTFDNVNYTSYKEFILDVTNGTVPSDVVTVISAVPEHVAVLKNQEFNLTVTTLKSVDRVKILNENGAKLSIIESSSVISGDYKIWNLKIKIGGAGDRVFKVYGAETLFDYPDTYEEFSIIVV